MHWIWPIVLGLGFVLLAALVNILVRFVLVKIFGTPEAFRAFIRERARKISRRSS
jgi:F0F1-type ATP synthase membrane subunit b/b'